MTPESEVLNNCIRFLKMHRKVAWCERMNTGAYKSTYYDDEGKAHYGFTRYGFKGCSDILGQLKDGKFLAVEVKKLDKKPAVERLTPDQKSFLEKVDRYGGLACVVDNLNDLEWFLEEDGIL